MTLQDLKLLHAYNAWANNRIFDALAAVPAEKLTQDLKTSHGSIFGTLVHMVGAEKMWLSRWLGKQDPAFLAVKDVPDLASLRNLWNTVGFETAKFLGTMSDKKLQDTFATVTSKGEKRMDVYWQALQHTVDHSSYHRGQVVAMMRQQGLVPPSTGLVNFYRETAKAGKKN